MIFIRKNSAYYSLFRIAFVLIVLLLSANNTYPQIGEWSQPVFLTDSLADNCNCAILPVYLGNGKDSLFIFWERSVDTSCTSIYYRDLYTLSPPKAILQQPNNHFKRPTVLRWYYEQIFHLFYETDQNGNIDIYYVKYQNGVFSDPVPFITSPEEDKNIQTSAKYIVWERNGDILYSELKFSGGNLYFTDPTLIDSGHCSNPVVHADREPVIAWQKSIKDKSIILYSHHDYYRQRWTNPDTLYQIGDNKNLSFSRSGHFPYLCWQNFIDTVSNICYCDLSREDNLVEKIDFFSGSSKSHPSIYDVPIPTMGLFKSHNRKYGILLTCELRPDSSTEICSNRFCLFPEDFIILYDQEKANRNPRLFNGYSTSGIYEVMNIWETKQDDHWRLMMSKIGFKLSGVQNHFSHFHPDFYLGQNFPNPFNSVTSIKYKIPQRSFITLKIFNNLGQEIKTLVEQTKPSGIYSVAWDGRNNEGLSVSSGIYFYQFAVNGFIIYKQMMLIR
ncbi:T9SS type A sorting domain-containing protein [candidate division KSB1 bacterium]|nr:T9SS type A sorting domain-containing protein [candidate division KSB1 bacterium]